MESVDDIQKADSEITREDGFKFPKEECENRKAVFNEEDLKASIEEIEKMDVILKTKETEEKKAKLFRIQAEEESRDILTKLLCSEMYSGIKINLQEFMRLLNEVEKPQNDPLYDLGQDSLTLSNVKKGEKKEKPSSFKFIERNIQLAKCGRGILSVTEEEKLRIENLLEDIEDSKVKNIDELNNVEVLKTKMICENQKNFYALDEETKIILDQIDQQLEVFIREKERPEESLSLLKKTENKKKHFDDDDDDDQENPSKQKLKKIESNRLKEINKFLNSVNSVSNEKITPLTVEEIKSLIQRCEQSLRLQQSLMTEEEKEWPSFKPPKEVIAELVSNAKLLMPKFQYRFDES